MNGGRQEGMKMETERTIRYAVLEDESTAQSNGRNSKGNVEEGNLVVDSARLSATGGRGGNRGRATTGLEGGRRASGRG